MNLITLKQPFYQIRPYFPLILIASGYFVAMNLFEAGQQLYYINRFSLGQETVSYLSLLKTHSVRWMIWLIISIPFIHFSLKNRITQSTFNLPFLTKYLVAIMGNLVLTIGSITCLQIVQDGAVLAEFGEYFQFFLAQKFPMFFSSYLGIVILVHLYIKQRALEGQLYEFLELKKKYQSVSQKLLVQKNETNNDLISIKIGDKIKLIPLTEITYIQSADYCVQVHTKSSKAYFLRQSMKAMESRLTTKGFIRIHRNSIINLGEIASLRFNPKAEVVLNSGKVLSIANSRVAAIRVVSKGINFG